MSSASTKSRETSASRSTSRRRSATSSMSADRAGRPPPRPSQPSRGPRLQRSTTRRLPPITPGGRGTGGLSLLRRDGSRSGRRWPGQRPEGGTGGGGGQLASRRRVAMSSRSRSPCNRRGWVRSPDRLRSREFGQQLESAAAALRVQPLHFPSQVAAASPMLRAVSQGRSHCAVDPVRSAAFLIRMVVEATTPGHHSGQSPRVSQVTPTTTAAMLQPSAVAAATPAATPRSPSRREDQPAVTHADNAGDQRPASAYPRNVVSISPNTHDSQAAPRARADGTTLPDAADRDAARRDQTGRVRVGRGQQARRGYGSTSGHLRTRPRGRSVSRRRPQRTRPCDGRGRRRSARMTGCHAVDADATYAVAVLAADGARRLRGRRPPAGGAARSVTPTARPPRPATADSTARGRSDLAAADPEPRVADDAGRRAETKTSTMRYVFPVAGEASYGSHPPRLSGRPNRRLQKLAGAGRDRRGRAGGQPRRQVRPF